MCYVLSLIMFYLSLCFIQLNLESMYAGSFGCILLAYISYFALLLCFFWLNVMCYDIWSAFRGNIRRSRGGDQKKFLFYCAYAFGVPTLLITIVLCIEELSLVHENYLPMFGMTNCWIKNDRIIEMIYVYAPITTIILVNIFLYSWTALKIFRVQKETAVIRNGESRKHNKSESDTDRYFLYLRLFIICGVTWSLESISWIFHDNIYIFYISDFLNCIQGLIIFLLFVWKPKIKQLIIKR
jgi:G protein-coupled receptor Mth (Methuselah protein)